MFRLIKLALYGFAGWSMYQMYLGMKQGRLGAGMQSSGEDLSRDLNEEDKGRMGTLSGPGRGATETTEEASGVSTPHVIGRGVTLQ